MADRSKIGADPGRGVADGAQGGSHARRGESATKPRWPLVVLVVGAVSAASIALGLVVVGPMIQQRMETPSPTLAAAAAPPAPGGGLPVPSAQVEIKEHIRRPPPPPPVHTALEQPAAGVPGAPAQDPTRPAAGASTETEESTAPAATGARPSISATIAAAGDDAGRAGARDGAATSARGARDARRSSAASQAEPSRPRATEVPKARERRLSPLEALPPVDTSADQLGAGRAREAVARDQASDPGAQAPTPTPPRARGSRSYHVQVGRFDDSDAAQRVRDELTSAGFSPRIVRTQRDGAVVYRVQVGTFTHRENAERQMDTLRSQSYESYIAEDEP